MATTVDHSIQPLPQHVIAQLRSSVTITSLADCIQQLLMNSECIYLPLRYIGILTQAQTGLDASAANIDLSVNLIRNSITIQDDGDGILPADIALIGQRYGTSRKVLFGRRPLTWIASYLESAYTNIKESYGFWISWRGSCFDVNTLSLRFNLTASQISIYPYSPPPLR